MLTQTYPYGQTVRLVGVFDVIDEDCVRVDTDPDTVTVMTKSPAGVIATFVYGVDADVKKDATGKYHYDVLVEEAGRWLYRWEATGAAAGVREWKFNVAEPLFASSP